MSGPPEDGTTPRDEARFLVCVGRIEDARVRDQRSRPTPDVRDARHSLVINDNDTRQQALDLVVGKWDRQTALSWALMIFVYACRPA